MSELMHEDIDYAISYCASHPDGRALLVRPTWRSLQNLNDDLQRKLMQSGCVLNITKMQWRFPNGSILDLGTLADEQDLRKYLARRWNAIGGSGWIGSPGLFEKLVAHCQRERLDR